MALTILGANGYENVSSLNGGFGGWVAAGYPVAGAKAAFAANFQTMLETMEAYNTINADGLMEQIVADEPPFILDVRTAAEVEEQGHIEGAVHIPLDQLAQNLNALPEDPATPIVTYCGSGWRATIAMTALHGMGWENVKALKATFADWVAAGNPVGEGLPEPSMVASTVEFDADMVAALEAMLQIYGVKPYGVTDAETLNTALVEKPDMVVMDVRTAEELANGVIDTGDVELVAIPLQELIAQLSQWPAADAEITIYCGSGHRSTMALTIMGILGYDTVSSLKGGFGGWTEAGYPVVEYAVP
jgi:rhodanese-related sulfurtransferase